MMKMGCMNIETTAMEVFSRHGWRFSNRIGLQMWLVETLFLCSQAQNFVGDSLDCSSLVCNKEQLYALVDTEARILIYSFL